MMQSMRLTNSGEKRLRTATSAMLCSLLVRSARSRGLGRLEAEIGIDLAHHFARAQIAGEEHQALFEIDRGVVAQPQDAFVQHAQQQARHGGRGFFDFVEQHQRQVALLAGHGVELLLGQHGLGFAMAQVAGRRADQLGDFVLHLELAAIHLEHVLLAAVQDFGQRFHGFGLARAGRSQQQEDAHRAAFRREAGLEHLDVGNDDARRGRLADHLLRQNRGQILDGFHGSLLRPALSALWLFHRTLWLDYSGGALAPRMRGASCDGLDPDLFHGVFVNLKSQYLHGYLCRGKKSPRTCGRSAVHCTCITNRGGRDVRSSTRNGVRMADSSMREVPEFTGAGK